MNLVTSGIFLLVKTHPGTTQEEIQEEHFHLKWKKQKESLLYLWLWGPSRSLSPCAVLSLPVLDLLGLASGSRGTASPSAERQYHAAGRGPDNNKTYFSHV